jgi:SAM-dependent methyltransferase
MTDIDELKTRLRATWTAGDFGQIARSYSPGAREFVDRLNVSAGHRVLDVACGTGNLAVPAAQHGAQVTGIDIAPPLLEQARAQARGLSVDFLEGDAEKLPFADESFDVVMSMFGAMFAPRPELVSQELLRVCKRGGRIALACWTPAGFVGQMFKLTAARVPPPAGMPSVLLWGDPDTVQQRLGAGCSELRFENRKIRLAFDNLEGRALIDFWRDYYGPTQKAFGALDAAGQEMLASDLQKLWADNNQASGGGTAVEAEYLATLGVRAS